MLMRQRDRKTPHKYTDFVITCEGDAFHVHSIILRPQSEYFDKIMDQEGLWKVGQLLCKLDCRLKSKLGVPG